jgi:hypothetical protein
MKEEATERKRRSRPCKTEPGLAVNVMKQQNLKAIGQLEMELLSCTLEIALEGI